MELERKKIICVFFLAAIVLVVFHLVGLVIYYTDSKQYSFVTDFFDFDYERNIPTMFSVLLYFLSAFLLLLLYLHERKNRQNDRHYWAGLMLIFLYLGFDEGAKIHERLGDWFSQFVVAEGFLYFPWFIPYLAMFVFLVALYFSFYLKLEKIVKIEFFVSALIFLVGAVGLDILGANEAFYNGTETLWYCFLYTLEECCEMFGILIFIYSLLGLISRRKIKLGVTLVNVH